MPETDPTSDVSALTVQLLSAYLANNTVPSEQLAELIRTTKTALSQEDSPAAAPAEPELFTPAVSARKSLASPEHIISLIDGKPYKTLKRHLASRGLTPEQYRSRYDLPASYPMVAPAYAEHRRAVAHRLGLGRKAPRPESGEEQAASSSIDAPETQPLPEPAEALAKTIERPKKAPANTGLRGRKKAATGGQDTFAETTGSVAPVADTSDLSPAPSDDIEAKVSGTRAPRKAKSASNETVHSATDSKPRGKNADPALEGARSAASGAITTAEGDGAKSKPVRRRGKIGLFKDAGEQADNSAAGADETAAGADANIAADVQAPSAPKPKARPSKRMAREPKSKTN